MAIVAIRSIIFLFTCLIPGLINILNVTNSLAYAFYMINFSSFVIFASKINRHISITSESVENINTLTVSNMLLTQAPDKQPQLKGLFHSLKMLII